MNKTQLRECSIEKFTAALDAAGLEEKSLSTGKPKYFRSHIEDNAINNMTLWLIYTWSDQINTSAENIRNAVSRNYIEAKVMSKNGLEDPSFMSLKSSIEESLTSCGFETVWNADDIDTDLVDSPIAFSSMTVSISLNDDGSIV